MNEECAEENTGKIRRYRTLPATEQSAKCFKLFGSVTVVLKE